MYSVAVERDFVARHFLIGGDWGAENQEHPHHYRVEVQLEGTELDEHHYLVDITAILAALDEIERRYRDQVLNALPEFKGDNPSVEHFSRVIWQRLAQRLSAPNVKAMTVKVWETASAWAAYREAR